MCRLASAYLRLGHQRQEDRVNRCVLAVDPQAGVKAVVALVRAQAQVVDVLRRVGQRGQRQRLGLVREAERVAAG